jgi:hypothetical protein
MPSADTRAVNEAETRESPNEPTKQTDVKKECEDQRNSSQTVVGKPMNITHVGFLYRNSNLA